MTFVAIMSAIVVIVSLITSFVPFAGAAFGIVVPAIGTLVALFAKPKFSLVFVALSIMLSCVVSLYAIQNTLFFILPPVLAGLVFGLLLKGKIGSSFAILISALTQAILNICIYYIINLIYEINIIKMLLDLINLSNHEHIEIILGLGILLFSLIHFVLSFLIIFPRIEYFIPPEKSKKRTTFAHLLTCCLSPIWMIVSVFTIPVFSYVFLGISIFSGCFIIYEIALEKKVWKWIYMILIGLITFAFFVAITPHVEWIPYTLLIIAVIPFMLPFTYIDSRTTIFAKNVSTITMSN